MANSDNNFLIKFKPDYIPLQEYIIDTKRLEHANTYSVIVTHVKNPSFLWAYLKDEDRDLKRLNFQLDSFYEKIEDDERTYAYLVKQPIPNLLVAARYSVSGNDICWYRAKILGPHEKVKTNHLVKVFYIDFGNIEYVALSDLRLLHKRFVTCAFSFPLSLSYAKPAKYNNKWSTKEIDAFKNKTLNREFSVKITHDIRWPLFFAEMNDTNGKSVLDYLINKNFACKSSLEELTIALHDYMTQENAFMNQYLVDNFYKYLTHVKQPVIKVAEKLPNRKFKVTMDGDSYLVSFDGYCSSIITPSEFYVRIKSEKDFYDDIEEKMKKFYSNNEELVKSHLEIDEINLCVAKKDSKFYRSMILQASISDQNILLVRLLDYGNIIEVSIDDIYPLMLDYAELPPACVYCKLSAIIPIESTWNKESIEFFKTKINKFTRYSSYISNADSLGYFEIELDKALEVDIYQKSSTLLLNGELVRLGHAEFNYELEPNILPQNGLDDDDVGEFKLKRIIDHINNYKVDPSELVYEGDLIKFDDVDVPVNSIKEQQQITITEDKNSNEIDRLLDSLDEALNEIPTLKPLQLVDPCELNTIKKDKNINEIDVPVNSIKEQQQITITEDKNSNEIDRLLDSLDEALNEIPTLKPLQLVDPCELNTIKKDKNINEIDGLLDSLDESINKVLTLEPLLPLGYSELKPIKVNKSSYKIDRSLDSVEETLNEVPTLKPLVPVGHRESSTQKIEELTEILDDWNPIKDHFNADTNIVNYNDENVGHILHGYEYEENARICRQFLRLGHCNRKNCPFIHTNDESKQVYLIESYKAIKTELEVGDSLIVEFTYIQTYTKYTARINEIWIEELKKFEMFSLYPEIKNRMEKHYSRGANKREKTLKKHADGELVAIYDEKTSTWYRGRVLSDSDMNLVNRELLVYLIDIGIETCVCIKNVYPLKPTFRHYDEEAFKFELYNVNISDNLLLNEEFFDHLMVLLFNKDYIYKAKVMGISKDDSYLINLCAFSPNQDKCIDINELINECMLYF